MKQSTAAQVARFALIGGIGFVIDGGLLTLLHSLYEFDLIQARICSFSIAVTVTWFLNRQQTFASQKSKRAAREWGRYAAINSVGALMNMGIFFWLVFRFSFLADTPLLPLAIAASIAMIFNFLASKHVVFQREQT